MSNSYNVGVNLWFNDNWINSVTGLLVLAVNPYAPPKRTINASAIARAEKVAVSSAFYTQKVITAKVSIARNSRQLMEESIDQLTNMLHGREKYLVVMQSGAPRRYTATLDAIDATEAKGGHCTLTLRFVCSDVFGYDVEYTTLVNQTGLTSGNRTDNLSWSGSAPWQLPVITVTYTALSGGDSNEVIIGNGNTGHQIVLNRAWAVNDVLVVDSHNRTVTVNGNDVDYGGTFPEFAPGSGSLVYSDDLASRTLDYNVKYYKRYA